LKTVLVIESVPASQSRLKSILHDAGYQAVVGRNSIEGRERFQRLRPEVVLVNLHLPSADGLELVAEIAASRPQPTVIAYASDPSIQLAVQAMRAGAWNYVALPATDTALIEIVAEAWSRQLDRRPPPRCNEAVIGDGNLVGSSQQMQIVREMLMSLAGSGAHVLLSGEIGTGKEACARAIHQLSGSAGPFIVVNCRTVSATELAKVIPGQLAKEQQISATLYLENLSDLDLVLQDRLLRFLEARAQVLSAEGKSAPRGMRIISALSVDPTAAIEAGTLRQELFYMLNVASIHLPPLRERGEDAIEIAESALREFASTRQTRFRQLSKDVEDLFRHHRWPGNVRQLRNAIQHVVLLHDAPIVTRDMLPKDLLAGGKARRDAQFAGLNTLLEGRTLNEIEKVVIEAVIARMNGSVPRAARALDVSPSTLYRKLAAWRRN